MEKGWLDIIDRKLSYWGRQVKRLNDPGLGYGSESIEYRLMREGAGASVKSHKEQDYHVSLEFDEIDQAVKSLPPKQYKVIMARYSLEHKCPWSNQYCDIPKSTFYRILKNAQLTLAPKILVDEWD